MKTTAKPIIKDKFWIVERDGNKIGTISVNDERFMFSSKEGVRFFDNRKQVERKLGKSIFEVDTAVEVSVEKAVHGFPSSTVPYNAMYDVKKGLPLFTKSAKSKSLYCAGYYIIQFDKGWVKSFCPKLITIERYPIKGPFVLELEMRQELSRVNK
jgi:hypothetical protein